MNVSESLIDKYHQGLCSPEEMKAIEKWLEDGEDVVAEFPTELSKEEIRMEIWDGVHAHVTQKTKVARPVFRIYAGMTAAAVVIITIGLGFLIRPAENAADAPEQIAVAEVSVAPQTEALKIEFGRESGAVYSKENQNLDFCGVIKITPKENMKLSFTSICDGNKETIKEIDVKGGTTYFAMDLKHQDSSELVVMDKSLVAELPPVLQNSLIAQFGI